MKYLKLIFIATILTSCGVKLPETMSKEEYKELNDGIYAEMQTSKGTMTIELFEEQTPVTVANFVALAEGNMENEAKPLGTPYYDGIIFHRIIKDFMIQGGDPDGTGRGGPGYSFEDEFVDGLKHDKKGILSMANAGPNTNGSQFFITEVPTPHLNGRHTVFGQVIDGIEVVDSLAAVKTAPGDKPVDDVVIEKVTIVKKGDQYKKYNAVERFKEGRKILKAKIEEEKKRLQKLKEEKEKEQRLEMEKSVQRHKELAAKVKETETGLKYLVLESGNGEIPVKGDTIKAHYTLRLEGGELIGTSVGNQPLNIIVGQTPLIPGWNKALTMFQRGSKVFLIIPPELGYGVHGRGPIPSKATLYFDMEILED